MASDAVCQTISGAVTGAIELQDGTGAEFGQVEIAGGGARKTGGPSKYEGCCDENEVSKRMDARSVSRAFYRFNLKSSQPWIWFVTFADRSQLENAGDERINPTAVSA